MDDTTLIVKTELTTVTIDREGIIRKSYNRPDVREEYDEARFVLDAITKYLAGKRVGVLVDSTNLGFMSSQARALHAGPEGAASCYALAILLKSHFTRVLFNYFIRTTEPLVPVHAFTSEKKAVAWLREQRVAARLKEMHSTEGTFS